MAATTRRPGAPADPVPDSPHDWAAQEARLHQAIARASDLPELVAVAAAIPQLAGEATACAADVAATTALISGLNDAVTAAVVKTVAADMAIDLQSCCWLSFGSQARGEQTIATDQDNGLVFAGDDGDGERPRWLAFGVQVNQALAACGYPLCQGRVMAGQPLCCLTQAEWCARFEHWMAHGSGNDLLAARIYFDLRPLVGNLALAQPLQALLCSPSASVPRLLKQMADIVLCNHVPLNWLGRPVTTRHQGRDVFDLKMSGTALFVDAGRLWGLAYRIPHPGTAVRLRMAASAMRVPAQELETWLQGFHELQRLRLQVQRLRGNDADPEQRCWAAWDELDTQQRQALRRALRAARGVQQRITLDYRR